MSIRGCRGLPEVHCILIQMHVRRAWWHVHRSSLRDENLGAEILRTGLAQHLPCHRGVGVAQLGELGPELTAAVLLDARGWDVLSGALVASGLHARGDGVSRSRQNLGASCHFLLETIAGSLDGIRAVLAEELVDVAAQNVGVREHDVIRRIVLSSCTDDGLVLAKSGAELLDDAGSLLELLGVLRLHRGDVVRLLNQRILKDAAVAVQQGRALFAEVLEDIEGLKTYCV